MPEETKPLSVEERKYYCGDSTCCNREPKHTISWMIRNVPGWAANRIQYGEKQEATIRDLQDKLVICHGTFVGELDGKSMPGTFHDGTDFACPGWWRGHDNGAKGAIKRAEKAEAENKRLTEKLEAIASVPFEPFSAAIAKSAIELEVV